MKSRKRILATLGLSIAFCLPLAAYADMDLIERNNIDIVNAENKYPTIIFPQDNLVELRNKNKGILPNMVVKCLSYNGTISGKLEVVPSNSYYRVDPIPKGEVNFVIHENESFKWDEAKFNNLLNVPEGFHFRFTPISFEKTHPNEHVTLVCKRPEPAGKD